MGLQPNIARKRTFAIKQCNRCGGALSPDAFAPTKSIFYADGALPICNSCIADYLEAHDFDWEAVNKVCQWADIPFVPREWERLHELNGNEVFGVYAEVFAQSEYEELGWHDYFQAFKDLKASGDIQEELPGIADQKRKQLFCFQSLEHQLFVLGIGLESGGIEHLFAQADAPAAPVRTGEIDQHGLVFRGSLGLGGFKIGHPLSGPGGCQSCQQHGGAKSLLEHAAIVALKSCCSKCIF